MNQNPADDEKLELDDSGWQPQEEPREPVPASPPEPKQDLGLELEGGSIHTSPEVMAAAKLAGDRGMGQPANLTELTCPSCSTRQTVKTVKVEERDAGRKDHFVQHESTTNEKSSMLATLSAVCAFFVLGFNVIMGGRLGFMAFMAVALMAFGIITGARSFAMMDEEGKLSPFAGGMAVGFGAIALFWFLI